MRPQTPAAIANLSYPDYLDWKKSNTSFSSFEAWDASVYLWRSPEGVQAVRSAHVSGGFFRSLGVAAMLGRVFTETDDTPAAPRAVVLTYGAWQSRFGGRQDLVGQSLILDNAPYSVIGVLPREFHFAMRAAEFFTTIHDPTHCRQSRGCHDLSGLGRLRDGVSLEAAMSETKAIAARLEKEYPESNKGRSARLVPFRDAIVGDIRPTLLVLSSGAGLLLLIAYVNVASLLLVRAESRKRETVLRGVLGASTARLIRQFVTEGVLLVAAAAALAIPAASVAIPRLFTLIPERRLRGMPYFRDAGLHPHVLLFAAAISLLAVMVFSLTPVLRLSLSNLREDLAGGGRGSAGTVWKRFGSNLVAVELAIAVVLLASAGLLGKSLYRMFHVDLNFNPANLATLEIDVRGAGYENNDQLRSAFPPARGAHLGHAGRGLRRPHQRPPNHLQLRFDGVSGAGPSLVRRARSRSRARDKRRLLQSVAGQADRRPLLHRSRRWLEAARGRDQSGAGQTVFPR